MFPYAHCFFLINNKNVTSETLPFSIRIYRIIYVNFPIFTIMKVSGHPRNNIRTALLKCLISLKIKMAVKSKGFDVNANSASKVYRTFAQGVNANHRKLRKFYFRQLLVRKLCCTNVWQEHTCSYVYRAIPNTKCVNENLLYMDGKVSQTLFFMYV